MKTIKLFLAVLFIALSLQMADSGTAQARPVSKFQVVVRFGPAHRRHYRHRVYRRPIVYHRPVRRWHRRAEWHRRHVMHRRY